MTQEKIHLFEQAGLGKPPYKYCGCEDNMWSPAPGVPAKPGGSCGYCCTGIRYCYHFISSDGKKFYVGSECCLKSGDKGLKQIVNQEKRKIQTKQRDIGNKKKINELNELLNKKDVWEFLASQPHPNNYYKLQGKTYADYVDYMMDPSNS